MQLSNLYNSQETAWIKKCVFSNIISLSILQVCTVKTRQIGIQTDPMPVEFDELVAEEKRKEEEEKKRKEEEERLAREAEDKELEARTNKL